MKENFIFAPKLELITEKSNRYDKSRYRGRDR